MYGHFLPYKIPDQQNAYEMLFYWQIWILTATLIAFQFLAYSPSDMASEQGTYQVYFQI